MASDTIICYFASLDSVLGTFVILIDLISFWKLYSDVIQVLDDEIRQVILGISGILIKASLLLGLAFCEVKSWHTLQYFFRRAGQC